MKRGNTESPRGDTPGIESQQPSDHVPPPSQHLPSINLVSTTRKMCEVVLCTG